MGVDSRKIAWAAGLFEGEGSWLQPKQGGYRASLAMTDLDAVLAFRRAVGFGKVDGPLFREDRKPMWTWRVQSFQHVQALGAMFWPWLCRRRRARLLEILADVLPHEDAEAVYDTRQLEELDLLNAALDWPA